MTTATSSARGARLVTNPVIPGFHPDPSIVRIGDSYLVANSTFEWFPGVRLHRSADLQRWEPAGHVFTDPAHLDLRDVPDSCGLWAPSLSVSGDRIWLVVGLVHTLGGAHKDIDILLTTAETAGGPWSQPVRLGGGGFDPSIFHDEDGRHWLVNMRWDHRPDHNSFAGITLQEVDEAGAVGPERLILDTGDSLLEGPNLYRHDGWYHLMLAEGGTGWNHGIAMARSRSIEGPYELSPHGPLLTTRDDPGQPLQKAGHGELVRSPDGEWFLVHLASRATTSSTGERYSVLGRETCLQRVAWGDDGWLRLAHGGHHPLVSVPAPGGAPLLDVAGPEEDSSEAMVDLSPEGLDDEWSALRETISPSWADLTARPGWLRLLGRRSLDSAVGVSLVARRVSAMPWSWRTVVEAQPTSPRERAGVVCWYDRRGHHALWLTGGEAGPQVVVASQDSAGYRELPTSVDISAWPAVHLRVEVDHRHVRFGVSPDGSGWVQAGEPLETLVVSDDYPGPLRFTGPMVGLAAVDSSRGTFTADFTACVETRRRRG